MSEARFLKTDRLLTKNEFDRVFAERTSASAGPFVVYVASNDVGLPRLGLVVSRKVGPAVVRNRWKRRLREAFRLEKHQLPRGVDLVVIPRRLEAMEVDGLRRLLVHTAHKLAGRISDAP